MVAPAQERRVSLDPSEPRSDYWAGFVFLREPARISRCWIGCTDRSGPAPPAPAPRPGFARVLAASNTGAFVAACARISAAFCEAERVGEGGPGFGQEPSRPRIAKAQTAGRSRSTVRRWRIYTPRHAPAATLERNLTFALKNEAIELAILKRLFLAVREEIAELVKQTPIGLYTRRIWFLYKWLLGPELNLPTADKISYVDAVDTELQFANSGQNSIRHRVRNNLPGTSDFWPLVFKMSCQALAELLPPPCGTGLSAGAETPACAGFSPFGLPSLTEAATRRMPPSRVLVKGLGQGSW